MSVYSMSPVWGHISNCEKSSDWGDNICGSTVIQRKACKSRKTSTSWLDHKFGASTHTHTHTNSGSHQPLVNEHLEKRVLTGTLTSSGRTWRWSLPPPPGPRSPVHHPHTVLEPWPDAPAGQRNQRECLLNQGQVMSRPHVVFPPCQSVVSWWGGGWRGSAWKMEAGLTTCQGIR